MSFGQDIFCSLDDLIKYTRSAISVGVSEIYHLETDGKMDETSLFFEFSTDV